MKIFFPLFTILLGVMLTACSPRVTTSRPTDADLSKYNSFAYLPNADVKMESDAGTDMVNGLIIDKLNAQMKQIGYTLDRNNPDLLVLIDTKKDTETRVDRDPVYTTGYRPAGSTLVSPYYRDYYYNGYNTYRNFAGYDRDYYQVETGSVVISLIDRETGATVWRGYSETIIDGYSTDEMRGLVETIFDEYPIETATTR